MKSRRLMLIVEVESTETIAELKEVVTDALNCESLSTNGPTTKVLQIQYNAARVKDKKK